MESGSRATIEQVRRREGKRKYDATNLFDHRHSQQVHGHHPAVLDCHRGGLDRLLHHGHDRLDYEIYHGHDPGHGLGPGLARGLYHDDRNPCHVYRPCAESNRLGFDVEMGSDRGEVECDHDDSGDRGQNQSARMQKEGCEPTTYRLAKGCRSKRGATRNKI